MVYSLGVNMPNLLLTTKCNRSCSYCFAREQMSSTVGMDFITWDNVIYIADFLSKDNYKTISLLGGEPLLHPQFLNIIEYLIARDFRITVFTNGICKKSIVKNIMKLCDKIPIECLNFVCNVNLMKWSTHDEIKSQEYFLNSLYKMTSLSFNMHELPIDLSYHLALIKKYKLSHHIRLGIANPTPNKYGSYIKAQHFKDFASSLINAITSIKDDINLGFDCGIPLCIFNDQQIGTLYKNMNGRIDFVCGPAIDIDPSMMTWSCFPMSNTIKKSLFEFNTIHEVYNWHKQQMNMKRNSLPKLFNNCNTCKYIKNGICSGGCLALLEENNEAIS